MTRMEDYNWKIDTGSRQGKLVAYFPHEKEGGLMHPKAGKRIPERMHAMLGELDSKGISYIVGMSVQGQLTRPGEKPAWERDAKELSELHGRGKLCHAVTVLDTNKFYEHYPLVKNTHEAIASVKGKAR